MKRRIVTVASILAVLSTFAAFSLAAEYWASKSSARYHVPDCQWAREIGPKDLVKFKTPEEAIRAGFQPCKMCKPPTISR